MQTKNYWWRSSRKLKVNKLKLNQRIILIFNCTKGTGFIRDAGVD